MTQGKQVFVSNVFRGCIGSRTCRSCGNIWTGTCLCLGTKCPKCNSTDSFETGNDPMDVEKMKMDPEELARKFPARRFEGKELIFYWQCAIGGGINAHYILPGDVYENLNDYDARDRARLYKEYGSADRAIVDMMQANERAKT